MANSVFKNILEAVQTGIQGLSLAGISSANVQIVKVFSDREALTPELPGILILPLGPERMNSREGTISSDDIWYPVGVAIFAADVQDQSIDFDQYLLWRESIRKKFISQPLAGVVSVRKCNVEPQEVVNPRRWLADNIWVSALVLRFMSRETRG